MRKRIVFAIVAATTVLGGAAIAVGDSSESREPAKSTAGSDPIPRKLGEVNRRLNQSLAARVSCQSMACINRTLTRLSETVRRLNREIFRCERLVNVTQYTGYLYSPDGGQTVFGTTALDYTEPGDPPSDRVVVYVC
jgi:hypothetical protein